MGRVRFSDNEHYGGGGGGSFFSLKNDKDVARVRIMLDGPEDLDNYCFSVHRVQLGDKYRNVSCLRSYNEPVDNCPFCQEYSNVAFKFFIPLYNIDKDEVQIWERGKNFAGKIASIVSRYGASGSLVGHIFEIERNGAKGDMKTTYEIFPVDEDDTTLDDLPEIPEILGDVYLLDKSVDDMNYYLDEGDFPPREVEDTEPVRRRGSGRKTEEEEDEYMNPPEEEEEERPVTRGNRTGSTRKSAGGNSQQRRTPARTDGVGNRRRQF